MSNAISLIISKAIKASGESVPRIRQNEMYEQSQFKTHRHLCSKTPRIQSKIACVTL